MHYEKNDFLNDSNYTYITCSVAPPSSVDSSTGWSDRTAAHWPIPPELPNWEDCCVHHSVHKTCYGKPILLCLLMLFLPSGISAPFFSADLFKSYQFVRSLMWPPHNFSCIFQRTSSLHYLISLFILFWHTILRLTLYNIFYAQWTQNKAYIYISKLLGLSKFILWLE